MELREIHIDRFGVWEQVAIRSLDSLSVVHIDDGGRPVDLAKFLFETLTGYRNTTPQQLGGRLVLHDEVLSTTWEVTRACDEDIESLQVVDLDEPNRERFEEFYDRYLKSHIDVIEKFFLPQDSYTGTERWNWIAGQPGLLEQLLPRGRKAVGLDFEGRFDFGSLSRHGERISQLAEHREMLLTELAELSVITAREHTAVEPNVLPMNRDTSDLEAAELKDELRLLKRQIGPLEAAVDLGERWAELRDLKNRSTKARPAEKLQGWLADFQALEMEKSDWQKELRLRRRPKKRKPKPFRPEIDRLLAQSEDLPLGVDEPVVASTPPKEIDPELLHASLLLDRARSEAETAQRRLTEFSKRHDLDWSRLLTEEPVQRPTEISSDSPIALEPPEVQLEELKRRRLWVREEHRYLQDTQALSTQTYVWIAILFTLSIAAIFGTLLVVSTSAQWILAAFGLCGMVSAGAIKLSIELRSSRQLHRATDRLRQIDYEILVLTESLMEQQRDAEAAKRLAETKLFAVQVQQDAVEANRRLDSAEVAFRELLSLRGLPITMTSAEVLSPTGRSTSHETVHMSSGRPPARTRQWIKHARKLLHRQQGEWPASHDVSELVSELEALRADLAGHTHVAAHSFPEDKQKQVRYELQRIEKAQKALFKRARVRDQFELERQLEQAEAYARTRQRVNKLDGELAYAIDSRTDGEEVRELLEAFDIDDLRVRLSDLNQQREQAANRLDSIQQVKAPPVEPAAKPSSQHQSRLDQVRLELAATETQIRSLIRKAQCGAVMRRVAGAIPNREVQPATNDYLSVLTEGQWDRFDWSASKGVTLSTGERAIPVEGSDEEENAWLALQLDVNERFRQTGKALPLVLFADELLASSDATRVFATLEHAARRGCQIILLSGDPQLANQLSEAGIAIVRIGLREHDQPTIRLADFSEPSPERPRLVR